MNTNNTSKFNKLFKVETNSNLKLNNKTSTAQTKIYFNSLKALLDKNDFGNFFSSLEIYLPHIQDKYPGLLLSIYQCWLLLYKAIEMTANYEMVFAKYIIPLCLQYPSQMHTLKTKQLYSYLGNSNMIIKDTMRLKGLVEQYVDRVILLVNTLIIDQSYANKTIDNQQNKINDESLVLIQIENQIVDLFQINNPIEYFLSKKTHSSTVFESNSFNVTQQEAIYNPLSTLSEIPIEDADETPIPNNTITLISDPNSNYHVYSKHPSQKKDKSKNSFKSENPFLKDFNPKFLKKENIDKKILRRFRAYIKEINQKTPDYLETFEKTFWNDFSDIKLLPPMQYTESPNKLVEFKSFNTKYLSWLFSKNGAAELFNSFVQQQGNDFLNSLIENYESKISKEHGIIEKLKAYLFQIPELYSQSKPSISSKESSFCIENASTCSDESLHKNEKLSKRINVFDLDDSYFNNTNDYREELLDLLEKDMDEMSENILIFNF